GAQGTGLRRSCRVGTAPPPPAGLLRECPRSPPWAEASSLSSLRRPAGSDGARLRIVGCRTWCCVRRPGGAGFRMRTGDRKGPAATGRPAPRMSPVSALGGGLLLEFAAQACRQRRGTAPDRRLSDVVLRPAPGGGGTPDADGRSEGPRRHRQARSANVPRPPPWAEASSLSSLRRPVGSDGARLRTVGCRTWCRFWGTGRNFGRDLANDELHQREGGGLRADRPRSCDAKKMLQRAMRHALKTF